ncbi:MAG: deoxyribonuclease IV [Trueperaceae bacterium]|nr:deoxyribonuclease IV [Trueperaceae bacterium]
MGILGAHVSTSGGVAKAFARGNDIGCEGLQIFVKSPNQWRAKPLAESDIVAFREARAAAPQPVVAHAAYLINLASPKEDVLATSIGALIDELARCDSLGLDGLVLHPGGHLGSGVDVGIETVARSLDKVLAQVPPGSTKILLENTAGQGTSLGSAFWELGKMIELTDQKQRLGVCIDSCHAFAAGYDLTTAEGYEALWADTDAQIGSARLGCIHVNDSKHAAGSHKDRHENIGEGLIGEGFFARLVNDARLASLPMMLETPLGDDELGHQRDLARLKSLRS